MRRTYSRKRYFELVGCHARSDSGPRAPTDLIVGFPGGEATTTSTRRSRLSRRWGFDGAFTFVFSPRAGTEAAGMDGQVSEEVKRERIEELIEVVQQLCCAPGTPTGSAGWKRCS